MTSSSKSIALVGAVLIAMTGCITGAAAESGKDAISITFEKNPALSNGQCNPLVTYAMPSQDSQMGIQTTYRMNGQSHVRSVTLKASGGVLTAKKEISGFDPEEAPCSAVSVELVTIKCSDPKTFMLAECGKAFDVQGEDLFGSFSQ